MIIFVALVLTSSSLAEDDLRRILRSPKATIKLYSDFKAGEGLKYSGSEDRLRFRLFRHSAEQVADFNEHDKSAKFGINFFSSMTEDEKKQYLGMNITDFIPQVNHLKSNPSLENVPTEKLWTNVGAVTEVKDQGSCGSCWTFAAVGGLETRYQQGSGKLRNFAEQEYLDCVYDGESDGCQGGWPDRAYQYSTSNGGRLAAAANYKYVGKDGTCKRDSVANAMVAMKINGYISAGGTEAATIKALTSGSLSVAFEVTTHFQQYIGGIMRDETCKGSINHGVTAVGYTPEYVLVKNSWGPHWGEQGFVKFARGYGNCQLFKYGSFPKLSKTQRSDTTPSDAATSYRPSDDNPTPKPPCVDKLDNCKDYEAFCGFLKEWAEEWCRQTCGFCQDDGECPSGTIRCSDGVCRHEHMCQ